MARPEFKFSVEIEQEQIDKCLQLLRDVGGNIEAALVRGINRAGPKGRTLVSKTVRDEVRLPAKYINGFTGGAKNVKRLEFKKANFKTLQGRITAPQDRMLLSRYSTDPALRDNLEKDFDSVPPQQPGGPLVMVKKNGAEKKVDGHFYLLLEGSKKIGIVRKQNPNMPGGARKYGNPFIVAYGPSIDQVFNTTRDELVMPKLNRWVKEETLIALDERLKKAVNLK